MNKKGLVLTIASLFVATYVFVRVQNSDPMMGTAMQDSANADQRTPTDGSELTGTAAENEQMDVATSANPIARVEVAKWQQERGYYMDLAGLPEDFTGMIYPAHSYQALDDDSLRQLAGSNDMTAAVILGDRLMGSPDEERQTEGMAAHYQAAKLGSTYSAITIGSQMVGASRTEHANANLVNRINGYAWFKVAAARGDPAGLSALNFAAGSDPLDPALLAEVCRRSSQILTELDAARVGQGLPALDRRKAPFSEELLRDDIFRDNNPCSIS